MFMLAHSAQASDVLKDIEEAVDACEVLYEQIKQSSCASPLGSLLDNAEIKVGLAINRLQLSIKQDNVDKAVLTAPNAVSPYFSFSLGESYFDHSSWGYEYGISYLDSYALDQRIKRGGSDELFDLGTYAAGYMIAIQPSVFYSIGRSDEKSDLYLLLGIGLSAGYSAIRGSAYLTEDANDTSTECYEAATQLHAGDTTAVERIQGECELIRFDSSGFGAGTRVFIAGKVNRFKAEIDMGFIKLSHDKYDIEPAEISLRLSYGIPL